MAETLGVAIVGAGMMGAVHSKASRLAGATLKGIAASSPQSAREAAAHLAHLGMERAYSNADEAIADPAVDVIHICTPNSTHYSIAMSALAAGKHVVCEKPLATSLSDARALAAAAQKAGRVAAVPFVYRYHPMVREARSLVQDGTVGALQLIHGSYLQDWLLGRDDTNWRVDAALGGPSRAFADIGSHWCDLIEWISGERFEAVVATLQTILPDRPTGTVGTFSSPAPGASLERQAVTTEDVAGALFRTTTGVLTTLTVSQVSAGRKNRLWFELDGARASLVFDQEDPERLWLGERDSTRLLVRDPSRGSAEQRRLATLPAGHAQGYAQCFEAFVADTYAVIRGEAREGLPTFEDGYRSAQIIDAVLRSSKARAWEPI